MQSLMSNLKNQRGSAPIKSIIAFIILAAVVYVCIKMVPVYMDKYKLEDKIKGDLQFAAQRFTGDLKKQLTDQIYLYLDEIGATYDKQRDVKVTYDGGSRKITVRVRYSRLHGVPGFPTEFTVDLENTPLKGM